MEVDKTNEKIHAKFNSRSTWLVLWVLAVALLIISLHSLALLKPALCIGLCTASLVLCFVGTIIGLCAKKTKLEIGDRLIFCKTVCGKQIYVPIDCVTGIKSGPFGVIYIYSPSFCIRCAFVSNAGEITHIIKSKLCEKQ